MTPAYFLDLIKYSGHSPDLTASEVVLMGSVISESLQYNLARKMNPADSDPVRQELIAQPAAIQCHAAQHTSVAGGLRKIAARHDRALDAIWEQMQQLSMWPSQWPSLGSLLLSDIWVSQERVGISSLSALSSSSARLPPIRCRDPWWLSLSPSSRVEPEIGEPPSGRGNPQSALRLSFSLLNF